MRTRRKAGRAHAAGAPMAASDRGDFVWQPVVGRARHSWHHVRSMRVARNRILVSIEFWPRRAGLACAGLAPTGAAPPGSAGRGDDRSPGRR